MLNMMISKMLQNVLNTTRAIKHIFVIIIRVLNFSVGHKTPIRPSCFRVAFQAQLATPSPAGKPGGGGYWLDRARQRTVPSLTYSMIKYDS